MNIYYCEVCGIRISSEDVVIHDTAFDKQNIVQYCKDHRPSTTVDVRVKPKSGKSSARLNAIQPIAFGTRSPGPQNESSPSQNSSISETPQIRPVATQNSNSLFQNILKSPGNLSIPNYPRTKNGRSHGSVWAGVLIGFMSAALLTYIGFANASTPGIDDWPLSTPSISKVQSPSNPSTESNKAEIQTDGGGNSSMPQTSKTGSSHTRTTNALPRDAVSKTPAAAPALPPVTVNENWIYISTKTDRYGISGFISTSGKAQFSEPELQVKSGIMTARKKVIRKIYIRMDLSGVNFVPTDSVLKLSKTSPSAAPPVPIMVYCITDPALNDTPLNSETSWRNAPANDADSAYGVDFTKTVLAGEFSVAANESAVEFKSDVLLNFVKERKNGKITFILTTSYSEQAILFAGDNHPTLPPPQLWLKR